MNNQHNKGISDEDIKDIKLMLLYGHMTNVAIAQYKGITQGQVSRIKLGDCYSSIDID